MRTDESLRRPRLLVIALLLLTSTPLTGQPKSADRWSGERPLLAAGGVDVVAGMKSVASLPEVGAEQFVTTFDGQKYRFASAANLQEFTADPARFAPVLAGRCVVTWVDQRRLAAGNPKFVIISAGRLFLFASDVERVKFAANPERYQNADLLFDGHSPVSVVEEQAIRPGDPAKSVIVEGCRIRFVDAAEFDKFTADPAKYFPVCHGLDPVTVADGAPVPGQLEFAIAYKNRLYVLSSAASRQRFLAEHANPAIADSDVAHGGQCVVSLAESKKKVAGHYGIAVLHLGQRYLFADEAARTKFRADPSKYLRPK